MRPTIRNSVTGLLALVTWLSAGVTVQAAEVDPAATAALKRMTDHLGSLQQFSVHTENTLEDQLDSGQRIDIGVSAQVTIKRPNQLRAERKGDLISQVFYYDGKSLTLYEPQAKVYATETAPETIEGMLDFARASLGLIVPAADLVYGNAYTLLMEGVTSAKVVGKSVIGGKSCDHLAFRRPGVDFQVWVADEGEPLPCKYVVTDTAPPGLLSVSTVMSDWSTAGSADATSFSFTAPEGVKQIPFMRLDQAQ